MVFILAQSRISYKRAIIPIFLDATSFTDEIAPSTAPCMTVGGLSSGGGLLGNISRYDGGGWGIRSPRVFSGP